MNTNEVEYTIEINEVTFCHCGAEMTSDHCSVCGCEEFEATCSMRGQVNEFTGQIRPFEQWADQ